MREPESVDADPDGGSSYARLASVLRGITGASDVRAVADG